MKNCIYILLTINAGIAWSFSWFSFSASNGVYLDCRLAWYSFSPYAWNSIFDQETIDTATKNLTVYCCRTWRASGPACEASDIKNSVWWAESAYLFDHLIDIWFRRLDAMEDDALRYNLPPDTKWKERQDKIKDLSDITKQQTPEAVIYAYQDIRNKTNDKINIVSTTCLATWYNQLSLWQRYQAACEIANCIAKNVVLAWPSDATSSRQRLLQKNPCDDITTARINNETAYVKQLLVRIWMRSVTNLVWQYTKNYFVWNRWQSLYENFASFDQWLIAITRKVQEWTPNCSK